MIVFISRIGLLCGLAALCCLNANTAAAQQCEVPGFQVQLLQAYPEVKYPSVVTCDDQGNLFVGEDPMDMPGPSTKEIDRILFYTFNPDGSIQRKTVFAENLSAVFGLIWHEGALYVLHAPHYTMFRDTDGDGVADERQDLADGFGPAAGIYGFNDHIVTGTRLGMDGRVYVSVGDKGVPLATGNDGSTISLEGGGVVRMRLDGTELEIFSAGTRNHLDVAMDSLDNIFTYDNTDDGLGWWTRFTHHVETGYYGYPYDYHPHPERHLPRIAEYGGGSPVGAACYRDASWPEQFHDAVFYCEWGKRKIQMFQNTPSGATFTTEQHDFLVPEPGSEFRPQDLCFSPDGRHMYVADWNFGGWMQNKESGRLYRVTYVGDDKTARPSPWNPDAALAEQLQFLASPSFDTRFSAQCWFSRQGKSGAAPLHQVLADSQSSPLAKIHAIWGLSAIAQQVRDFDPLPDWISALRDSDARVRTQAARAIGQRQATSVWSVYDVAQLGRRELPPADLAPPSPAAVQALISALQDDQPTVQMQAAVALGRIGAVSAAGPLFATLGDDDDFVRFTAIQALRAINDWSDARAAVTSSSARVASGAVLAMTHVYDVGAVQGLALAALSAHLPDVQAQAMSALGEVFQKADPYLKGWWGTRPAMSQPSRLHQHRWEGTDAVAAAVQQGLQDAQPLVRRNAISAAAQMKLPQLAELLRPIVAADADEEVRLAGLQALAALKNADLVPTLVEVARNAQTSPRVREAAVDTIGAIGSPAAVETLVTLAQDDKSSPALIQRSLNALRMMKAASGLTAAQRQLTHNDAGVRAEAIRLLAALNEPAAANSILPLLSDPVASVRVAALQALAAVQAKSAVPEMLKLTTDQEVRNDAILALAALADRRALNVYLAGLIDKNPEVREACRTSVGTLRPQITSDLQQLHQRNELAPEVRRELGVLLASPKPIQNWSLLGAWPRPIDGPEFHFDAAPDLSSPLRAGDFVMHWQQIHTDNPHGKISPSSSVKLTNDAWVMAYTTIEADAPAKVNFAIGSDDEAILNVNGQQVYEFRGNRGWAANQGVGSFELRKGTNHIWLQCGNNSGPWDFSLAVGGPDPQLAFLYEDIPPALDLAAFRQRALQGHGDQQKGKQLFFAQQGIGCVKCHSIGDEGTAKVGPNLQGVGTRYPREELIRSVLEPSNRIFSGYEMTVLALDDGRIVQGIIKSENDTAIELVDIKGEVITVPASAVEERQKSNLSAMPNGLEKGMSLEDFADIIAYLESVKGTPPEPAQ